LRVRFPCLLPLAALAKRQFDLLLRPGGRVIQFGFTTTCMPIEIEREGGTVRYRREAVAIFNTLGRMNDYLGTMDVKAGDEAETEPRWFAWLLWESAGVAPRKSRCTSLTNVGG